MSVPYYTYNGYPVISNVQNKVISDVIDCSSISTSSITSNVIYSNTANTSEIANLNVDNLLIDGTNVSEKIKNALGHNDIDEMVDFSTATASSFQNNKYYLNLSTTSSISIGGLPARIYTKNYIYKCHITNNVLDPFDEIIPDSNTLIHNNTDNNTYFYDGTNIICITIGREYRNGAYIGEIFNDYEHNVASGNKSHAEGYSTTASSNQAHAEGANTIASGSQAHAEGNHTTASGNYSHCGGQYTLANSRCMTTIGVFNTDDHTALNYINRLFVVGNGTGSASTSDAFEVKSSGEVIINSTASNTTPKLTIGSSKSIEGTTAPNTSDIQDDKIIATKNYVNSKVIQVDYFYDFENIPFYTTFVNNEIYLSLTTTSSISVQGLPARVYTKYYLYKCNITNDTLEPFDEIIPESNIIIKENETKLKFFYDGTNLQCITIGRLYNDNLLTLGESFNNIENEASGGYSHAEGYRTKATGGYSHAEGNGTIASGQQSHSEGWTTTASGSASHAEGNNTTASGNYSHAEGSETTASSSYSHAEGMETTASGQYSHTEGYKSTASQLVSHAEGDKTTASGQSSHAEGRLTTASGNFSHSAGNTTIANSKSMTAIGQYNTNDGTAYNITNRLLVIGNGTANDALSDAFEVYFSGEVKINSTASGSTPKLTLGSYKTIEGTTAPNTSQNEDDKIIATKYYVDDILSELNINYQKFIHYGPGTVYYSLFDPTTSTRTYNNLTTYMQISYDYNNNNPKCYIKIPKIELDLSTTNYNVSIMNVQIDNLGHHYRFAKNYMPERERLSCGTFSGCYRDSDAYIHYIRGILTTMYNQTIPSDAPALYYDYIVDLYFVQNTSSISSTPGSTVWHLHNEETTSKMPINGYVDLSIEFVPDTFTISTI